MRTVRLGHLKVSERAKSNVLAALDADRLSYGPWTRSFEQSFARLHDSAHAVFVNSGTSALVVALGALKEKYGWHDGDGIIVPSVTFVATANAVLHNRMHPIFRDVDAETFVLSPEEVKRHHRIRRNDEDFRAVMPVHLFGLPCDCDYDLPAAVLEDSCEAMFVSLRGRKVGSLGDFGCFSTYVCHILTTGVGGLVTCRDEADAKLVRSLAQHGRNMNYLSIDDDAPWSDKFRFPYVGHSFRVTEMEAALGVAALEEHERAIVARQSAAHRYRLRLSKHAGRVSLQRVPNDREHCWMFFPLVLGTFREQAPAGPRDRLARHLEVNGVETRPAMPLVNQPCYTRLYGELEKDYPVAAWLNRCGLCLPCHDGMSADDVHYVCGLVDDWLKGERL